jgi:hypothetical protein
MTDYVTAAGVQHFAITIASGNTAGTATINAVGSGAFILYGGCAPSTANNPSRSQARLTKTNSTTITATRNSGTSSTLVIKGCIIDGDTTNLIESVQYNTVTLTGVSSNTASISSVTNANTALHFLGQSSSNSTWDGSACNVRLSLSGTTVTADRTLGLDNIIVSFVAIEFKGSTLNQSVQNISTSSGTPASWTTTINSVDTNNAITLYAGLSIDNTSTSPAACLVRGYITSSTVFTCDNNSADIRIRTYNATVVEFVSGVLNSNVQRGTTTLTGVTSNTTSITSIDETVTGISYLGQSSSSTTAVLNRAETNVELGAMDEVLVTKNTATANTTTSWEVFEFPPYAPSPASPFTGNNRWFSMDGL